MASLGFPTIPLSSSATSSLPVGRQAPFFFFSSLRVRTLHRALDAASRRTRVPRIGGSRHHRRFLPTSAAGQSQVPKKREPMVPPYNVLITGSTKGIGYALAKEFLKAGDSVLICSRSAEIFTHISRQYAAERVELTVKKLKEEFGEQRVWGTVCDVSEGKDVKSLVAFARDNLKYVDIWINNAGSNAYNHKPLSETSDEDLIFQMAACQAINMMLIQPRGGHIFNMDGAGSDGRPTPRFAAYGATKRSVVHLTKSLQAELQMHEVKNVLVHNLSPGMVTTDLLMSGANTKQAKFFINILAEPPEEVADFLVRCIRAIPIKGTTKPSYIRFLTGFKAYSQIFSRIAFGTRRNRYILED